MGNQASADGAVVETPPSPAPEGLPSTLDIASKPRVPPMSTKRPGGCGMAVPPQRHLAHAHTQQRLQTQPQSAYGTRQSVSERSSPTRWSNSPARTSVPAATQGAKSPKSPTLLSPPPAPPPLPPGEVKKQELVQKLSKIVKSTSIKQVIENSSPTAHVVPENYRVPPDRRQSWLSKLTQTKEEALLHLKSLPGQASRRYSEPMSQEQVGHSVETSLGEDLPTFASYQGTIHEVMAQGLKTEMLDNFLFDEEGEQQLTTYEKWEVIRHAAEQMLQVYANRSNSSFIEHEQWQPPTVVDANTVSQSGYAKAVDRAMSRGEVALMFIDDGRQCQLSAQEGDIAPLICTDLWQAIKELAPNKVPSTQRLEHLTAAGRHLLHASVSVETWYGASALMKTKAVVAIDSEHEHFFLSELQKWGWFGFMPDNVVILPLPRFHGFAEDQRTGKLAHVKNSAKLMLGTGYALFLLNSPAEAYTLSVGGEPRCLSGSVLSWLDDQHTSWLFSGLFSDVQRLRPEALVDVDFLAAALYCADRGGCNMAMEVVQGEGERDVRVHDSIVLRRGDAGAGSCALRASAMRTVRSYQIIQQNVPVSAGGTGLSHVPGPYLCTQRYAFKVPALQQLLIDATQFHMDVVLYGFYAYANFDLSDITTARNSSCACILAGGHKGPPMVDVVLGKNWLSTTAAPVLEAQDKVAEFRRKAMELLRVERGGATSPGHQLPGLGFKERRAGFSVVLFLTMEHGTASLALAAMRMARLFVLNIVDRLHLVTIIGGADNRSTAKAMLDDMVDKELDFQGQVVREVITRESGPASGGRDTLGCMRTYCQAVSAKLVVVPSSRLASSSMTELGGASSSLALLVLRSLTTIPVLLVKANSVGRFATSVSRSVSATGTSGGGGNLSSTGSLSSLSPASSLTQRPGLVVMCHLDTSQASTLVESITPFLVPSQDVLYLARTQAFEKPGQLSMRSRRMFVQARMAVANVLKVEERAYASTASAELPKAVEAEGVDLLVVSASGSLAPSKEVEDIVRAAKAAGIYVHRIVEGGQRPAGTLVNNLM